MRVSSLMKATAVLKVNCKINEQTRSFMKNIQNCSNPLTVVIFHWQYCLAKDPRLKIKQNRNFMYNNKNNA